MTSRKTYISTILKKYFNFRKLILIKYLLLKYFVANKTTA